MHSKLSILPTCIDNLFSDVCCHGSLFINCLSCCMRLAVIVTQGQSWLTLIEYFSGTRSICNAFADMYGAEGVASFERDESPRWQDINTGRGFAMALALTLRGRPGAFLQFLAPVCSTWVWACRASRGNLYTTCIRFQTSPPFPAVPGLFPGANTQRSRDMFVSFPDVL